jgi:RNA polymerase sigma factor for flagellar operon FliA
MKKSKSTAIRSNNARAIRKAPLRRGPSQSIIGTCRTQRAPPPLRSHPVAQEVATLVRRDAFVLAHIALAKIIAVRVRANLPVHVELEDLIQAGILGLIDAATKFDSQKHVAFSSFAKHRMRGAMLDSLRKLDWASRDMRQRQSRVEVATRALETILLRAPTETEVAEKLGIGIDRWRRIMLDWSNVSHVSLSSRANDNDDLPAPYVPATLLSQPDSICAHAQLRGVLGEATKTLPECYQRVIVLYYTKEMTMKEIGDILGVNESRVSQIHKSALQKMAGALHENGIHSSHAF